MIKQRGKWSFDVLQVSKKLFTKNAGVEIYNNTGLALTVGQLVYINGFDGTKNLPTVALAVNTARPAVMVVKEQIANGATGMVYFEADVTGIDTSGAAAVGSLVYLNSVSGGWTLTSPTLSTQAVQEIGTVTVKAVAGSIYFYPGRFVLQKIIKAMIQVNSLDGAVVANVADSNTTGGIPVIYRIPIPDGATGNVDVVMDHKIRVIDAHVVKTTAAGGVGDTITVNNGAIAITDAMSINVADKVVVKAGTIDDAQHEIAAAGTLRVVRTKASALDVSCIVYVSALRIA